MSQYLLKSGAPPHFHVPGDLNQDGQPTAAPSAIDGVDMHPSSLMSSVAPLQSLSLPSHTSGDGVWICLQTGSPNAVGHAHEPFLHSPVWPGTSQMPLGATQRFRHVPEAHSKPGQHSSFEWQAPMSRLPHSRHLPVIHTSVPQQSAFAAQLSPVGRQHLPPRHAVPSQHGLSPSQASRKFLQVTHTPRGLGG